MKAVANRVLFSLAFAYSFLAVGCAAASGCCGYGPDGGSIPSLSYSLYRDNPNPSIYGYASVSYPSSCGACITASFNLIDPKKSCTFKGSLPAITSYKCKYYPGSLREYSSQKQYPKNLACTYYSDVTKNLNDTHYESCSVNYLGVAEAEFDVTRPGGVATVNCKGLVGSPVSCYTTQV